jgi:GrpB-like predicted nucleotidyltransferase (UPF0157 family)/GNAT superfamily N-acetyltransferase
MSSWSIRRATRRDTVEVAEVYVASRRSSYPSIPPLAHDDEEVRTWFADAVFPEKEVWVAESGSSDIVGLMVLAADWVEQLYVHPAHLRAGVGTELVAVAKARRPNGLQLRTFESNHDARRFYERHGFMAVERTDGTSNEEQARDVRYVWSPGSDTDPVSAWKQLRAVKGGRATVIDLYRLAAEPRGLDAHELPRDERLRLARSIMPVVWPGFEVTEGSDRDDPIVLVPYDADWPRRFEDWCNRIVERIGTVAQRVEHVGSTSVPGLYAKPIIDVQVSVLNMDDEVGYVDPLESIGLQLRSRDELHRYFRPFPGEVRGVHVHVCNVGSDWERDHLLFRDYLRLHRAGAARYAAAKADAVRLWATDGWAYTDAKTEAILDILDRAQAWGLANDWRP